MKIAAKYYIGLISVLMVFSGTFGLGFCA